MQYGFAVGILSLIPTGSNPTPLMCGVLKDVTVDLTPGEIKKLRGQNKFPVAIAEGPASITGKAAFARMFAALYTQILNGSSQTGMTIGALNEVGTIPASPAYTVTVTNSATFVEDLGVIDVNTGLAMLRVASGPATGQYAVSAGVYTFAAADASHVVWINYSYTSTAGYTVTVANSLMGSGNSCALTCYNQYQSKYFGMRFPSIVCPKLSVALKSEDFTEQNVDFEAFADSGGKVAYFYSSE